MTIEYSWLAIVDNPHVACAYVTKFLYKQHSLTGPDICHNNHIMVYCQAYITEMTLKGH